jgi:hypothetical protein
MYILICIKVRICVQLGSWVSCILVCTQSFVDFVILYFHFYCTVSVVLVFMLFSGYFFNIRYHYFLNIVYLNMCVYMWRDLHLHTIRWEEVA